MSEEQQTNFIREARHRAGLSQQQVAELANCSVAYVRMIDSGYRPNKSSEAYSRVLAVLDHEKGERPAVEPGARKDRCIGRHKPCPTEPEQGK